MIYDFDPELFACIANKVACCHLVACCDNNDFAKEKIWASIKFIFNPQKNTKTRY